MKNLQTLRNNIQNLEKIHQIQILKLFKIHHVPFTENSNGIFVNMKEIPSIVLTELDTYLKYVNLQESHLNEGEVAREVYKMSLENNT